MSDRTAGERIFLIFLMIILLVFFIGSLSFRPGLRVMPLVFSALGLMLLAALAVDRFAPSAREWIGLGGAASRGKQRAPADQLNETPADVARIISYMIAFFGLVFLMGMAVAIPLYVALFLKVEARARWHHAILAGALTTVIVVAGMKLMRLTLWTGIIPTIIPRYVGGAQMPLF
jgi:hypothetical protein